MTFPGCYQDERGVEPLEWRITPTWPVGWPPGFAVSTVIRGVRVRGGDFDTLLPRHRGDGDGVLRWDRIGLVDCVLTGDLPVTLMVGGVVRETVLSFRLDLRRAARTEPETGTLRLSCRVDGIETAVTDDWFEDGLAALAAALPGDTELMACATCVHADYSPTGHGLSGMRCHRDAAACEGIVTEEVLESYLCTAYRRRPSAADHPRSPAA